MILRITRERENKQQRTSDTCRWVHRCPMMTPTRMYTKIPRILMYLVVDVPLAYRDECVDRWYCWWLCPSIGFVVDQPGSIPRESAERSVEYFVSSWSIARRSDEADQDERENYDWSRWRNSAATTSNDCHRIERDDCVDDVERCLPSDHEHWSPDEQVLTMATKGNSLWVEEEEQQQQEAQVRLLRVTRVDRLDRSYPVQANFEDNSDERDVHLNRRESISISSSSRVLRIYMADIEPCRTSPNRSNRLLPVMIDGSVWDTSVRDRIWSTADISFPCVTWRCDTTCVSSSVELTRETMVSIAWRRSTMTWTWRFGDRITFANDEECQWSTWTHRRRTPDSKAMTNEIHSKSAIEIDRVVVEGTNDIERDI